MLVGTALLVLAATASAATQQLKVVVVPGLELSDLAPLQGKAALGLLVPGAGPRISGESARESLERGVARNSLRGGPLTDPIRIRFTESDSVPSTPEGTIVVGLPSGGEQDNDSRYPIAVVTSGFHGLLTSSRTHVPGLVAIDDVAPTALGEKTGLGSQPESEPTAALQTLDARIRANERARPLAALMAGLLVFGLAFVFPRAALLGFPAAAAANLALGAAGVSATWAVLLVIGLAVAVGAPLLALAARGPLALGCLCAAVIAAYLLALGLDGTVVSLSPLGPSQNQRYYGLSNLLSAVLLVPALAGVALLRAGAGWPEAILLAAASLVTIAGSRFGADGGTAVVLVIAYGVLASELAEARRRVMVVVAAAGAAAVAALIAVDALSGASSHLTSAIGGGAGGFAADLRDRIVLSWERSTEFWYLIVLVVAGALVLALLAVRLGLSGLPRSVRALPISLAVAVGVSLLVNDSPLDVIAIGLVSYVAAQAYVLREPDVFDVN